MGCWAIGGPAWRGDDPIGWGEVDDQESIKGIHRAIDLGVNLFDTANVYGCGHSERILGRALKGKRNGIVVATKFTATFDETSRKVTGADVSPAGIKKACEESLQRLGIDSIDLYQFHSAGHDLKEAVTVRETLEELVEEGKIRTYGWSTDDPERTRLFAEGPNCTAVQQHLNVFGGNLETLQVCEELNLASLNRGPLGMGVLTGKFNRNTTLPEDDVRRSWKFDEGQRAEELTKLEAVREILTSNGRTLAQGALAWLWAKSEKTLPIPGFKSVSQVEENATAMQNGPLSTEQMHEIESVVFLAARS